MCLVKQLFLSMPVSWRQVLTIWVVAVSSFAHGQAGSIESNPRALTVLERVESSLNSVSYTGIYTYEHTGVMDSIKVSRLIGQDNYSARVEHLSGRESKAIVRQVKDAGCDGDLAQRQSVFNSANLDRYYRFELLGSERVAGRKAMLLRADPRDDYRFGYRMAVDEQTGVPLLLALISGNSLLERFQFVDFTPVEASSAQVPETSQQDLQLSNPCLETYDQSRWAMGWLPGGYQLVSVKSDNGTDMYSFSDGLSRVSVFVSALAGGATLEGEARRGATIVYLDKVVAAGRVYQVSVVGEVPKAAAQKLAASVLERR